VGGGRVGVRAEARGNGARAGAARARMPRRKGTTCPPPPCRRRRWRPTRPGTHRRGGEGGRRSGPVGKVENWAQCACSNEPSTAFRAVRGGWRPPAPPQTRRHALPRRDRGRQADHEAAAAASACALARGIRTSGGRWRARPGGWTRQWGARSWWQAGPSGRAGGGERAGARGPPLAARCAAARLSSGRATRSARVALARSPPP